jgi:hypothetical protein
MKSNITKPFFAFVLLLLILAPRMQAQKRVNYKDFDSINVSYIAFLGIIADIHYCRDSTTMTFSSFVDGDTVVKFDDTTTARFLQRLQNGVFDDESLKKYKDMIITDCPCVSVSCYRKGKLKYSKYIDYGMGELTPKYKRFNDWLTDIFDQLGNDKQQQRR